VLLAVVAGAGVAYAQPGVTPPVGPSPPAPKPPDPPPPPPKTADDPVLAEQVASSLVQRAQELYDARVFTDAKQLAVEALVKSPKGPAAEQARALIKSINQQLGIVEAQPDKVDLTPIKDPTLVDKPLEPSPERPAARRLTTSVHTGLYVGLLGTTVGAFFSKDTPAGGAVPLGIGAGLAGGYYLPRLVDRLHWTEGQVRTAGSFSVWGGVAGGMFGDVAKKQGSSSRHVLVGASIGATVGLAGGVLVARKNQYTPGDIALVDTFAGMGAVGGITLGMLMQPAESEAYSLNSALGAAGGVVVGLIAAPQTNTTPRRMLRVAGLAAAGGAVPFLLYAGIYDDTSAGDERAVGALSSLGLIAGAYIGFRITSGMDAGKDVIPGAKSSEPDDAPPAVVGRTSLGRWKLGTVTVQPLSRELAPQSGMAVPLVAGAW
jgi:hypothetical protein